jgi:hypothetical protein
VCLYMQVGALVTNVVHAPKLQNWNFKNAAHKHEPGPNIALALVNHINLVILVLCLVIDQNLALFFYFP